MFAADNLQGPPVDWFALSPLLILLGGAMVLLLVSALAIVLAAVWTSARGRDVKRRVPRTS